MDSVYDFLLANIARKYTDNTWSMYVVGVKAKYMCYAWLDSNMCLHRDGVTEIVPGVRGRDKLILCASRKWVTRKDGMMECVGLTFHNPARILDILTHNSEMAGYDLRFRIVEVPRIEYNNMLKEWRKHGDRFYR